MKFPLLFLLVACCLLTACDTGFKYSDYIGGFVTQSGDCTDTGDLSINHENKKIEVGFYCFLKKCADMEGKTSQGGFFHLENKEGHYIQGRVLPEEAKGTWYLSIKGQSCSGHWVALKN